VGRGGTGRTRHLADALIAVVLAPACAACREPLSHPTRGAVCDGCWHSILPLTPPLCDICGDPLPVWDGPNRPCSSCIAIPRAVSRARAIGSYEGALREVIHAFKYDARRSLAKPIAALMSGRGEEVLAGADVIVPVPLHPSRRRQRGFNQAADLARQVARHAGLPTITALRRVRATTAQAGLPATQRVGNVRGAFVASAACTTARGRVVVLIDDVSTTGATLDVCAQALLAAGVSEVRALTAARVVTSRR
jgi:ComF family protein